MRLGLLAVLAALLVACAPATTVDHGVPNLRRVDDRVWRSGQPAPASWAYLRSLGITDAVKLNFAPNEGSDDGAAAAGIAVHYLPVQPEGDADLYDEVTGALVLPDRASLREAEELLRRPAVDDGRRWLVHCTHGWDRTGRAVMEYRVGEGWSRDAAVREGVALGFHFGVLVGLTRSLEWLGSP